MRQLKHIQVITREMVKPALHDHFNVLAERFSNLAPGHIIFLGRPDRLGPTQDHLLREAVVGAYLECRFQFAAELFQMISGSLSSEKPAVLEAVHLLSQEGLEAWAHRVREVAAQTGLLHPPDTRVSEFQVFEARVQMFLRTGRRAGALDYIDRTHITGEPRNLLLALTQQ